MQSTDIMKFLFKNNKLEINYCEECIKIEPQGNFFLLSSRYPFMVAKDRSSIDLCCRLSNQHKAIYSVHIVTYHEGRCRIVYSEIWKTK